MIKSIHRAAEQLTRFPAQHYPTVIGYMSSLKDIIVNKAYSGNFSDLLNPVSFGLTVNEHYSQFGKLLKDIEHANQYRIKIAKYIKDIPADEAKYCSLPYLNQVFKEFSEFIDEFKKDSDIHKQLLKQQKELNHVIDMYNEVKDPETLKDAATAAIDRMNIRSWPTWYRTELAAQVNRMNMALDELLYEMNLKVSNKVCSLSKPKGKTILPSPPVLSRSAVKRIQKIESALKIIEEHPAAAAATKSAHATSPHKKFAVTSKKSSSQKSRNHKSRKNKK